MLQLNALSARIIKSTTQPGSAGRNFFKRIWPIPATVCIQLPNYNEFRIHSKSDRQLASGLFWNGWPQGISPAVHVFFYLSRRTNTIVDLSAGGGMFAILAGLSNPQATVIAFEPVPKKFAQLQANLALNPLRHLEAEQKGVSDKEGFDKLRIARNGNHLVPSNGSDKGNHEEIRTAMVALDQYRLRQGLDTIGLLKVTVNHTLPDALKGMPEVWENDRPVVLVEQAPNGQQEDSNDGQKALQETLEQHNYIRYEITPETLIRKEGIEFPKGEPFLLFAPQESYEDVLYFDDMDSLVRALR